MSPITLPPDCRVGSTLLQLDSVDSTNSEIKRLAAQNAPDGLVVTARRQTAGRGRAGRTFHSPQGCGLYLSALLRPQLPPEAVAHFTAWTAVAVCDAVEATCGLRPQIKWINDLILNEKKLCGVLTELLLTDGRPDALVVGIGINVNHRPEDFPPELRESATSLAMELGQTVDLEELTRALILALNRLYADFPAQRANYLRRYRADCLTLGRLVRLTTPTDWRDAVAVDIDEEFRLLVELPDGSREAVRTGEASVRGPNGYL